MRGKWKHEGFEQEGKETADPERVNQCNHKEALEGASFGSQIGKRIITLVKRLLQLNLGGTGEVPFKITIIKALFQLFGGRLHKFCFFVPNSDLFER